MASTGFETARNLGLGLAAGALSLYALQALGLRAEDLEHQAMAAAHDMWPVAMGLMAGMLQNRLMWRDALNRLEGHTVQGDREYTLLTDRKGREHVLVNLDCIDGRITASGLRKPGGYVRVGLGPASLAVGELVADLAGNVSPVALALVGHAIGVNAISSLAGVTDLLAEVNDFAGEHHDRIVHANARIHFLGCGAEAAGSVAHWLKFYAGNPLGGLPVDAIGFPAKVAAFAVVNTLLSPAEYLATGGRVSLTASLWPSPMGGAH